jgi:hypothetical protein
MVGVPVPSGAGGELNGFLYQLSSPSVPRDLKKWDDALDCNKQAFKQAHRPAGTRGTHMI